MDAHLATFPAGERDRIREWAKTGDDTEATVYRLRRRDPTDRLHAGVVGNNRVRGGPCQRGGRPPGRPSQRVTHTAEMARQLMDGVADGRKAPA